MSDLLSTWTQTTIGAECTVIAGQSPEGRFYNNEGYGMPFYQGKKEFGEKFIGRPTKWTTKTTKEAKEYDVLLSVRAPVGPVNFATQPICIGRGLAAIRTKESLDADFLFYLLLAKQKEIRGTEGAVFASINKNQIERVNFSRPPLPEQKRIVAILDEAFAGIDQAIANTEKNIANAKELFESHREATLCNSKNNWCGSNIGELVEIKHGFAFKSEWFSETGDNVLLTPGNFWERGGYRDRGKKQRSYVGQIPDGYILNGGDLLLVMTEQAPGLLGSPMLVPEAGVFLHNQRLGLVQPRKGINWSSDFFFHIFNTRSFRKEVYRTGTGIKVRHTSPQKICNVVISYPEESIEQESVAARLDTLACQCGELEIIQDNVWTLLSELKQSILQKTFSGEPTENVVH